MAISPDREHPGRLGKLLLIRATAAALALLSTSCVGNSNTTTSTSPGTTPAVNALPNSIANRPRVTPGTDTGTPRPTQGSIISAPGPRPTSGPRTIPLPAATSIPAATATALQIPTKRASERIKTTAIPTAVASANSKRSMAAGPLPLRQQPTVFGTDSDSDDDFTQALNTTDPQDSTSF